MTNAQCNRLSYFGPYWNTIIGRTPDNLFTAFSIPLACVQCRRNPFFQVCLPSAETCKL
jgi:hypothetical protein